MKQNHQIVLLSQENWLDSLALSTWVLLDKYRDYFYINTEKWQDDLKKLEHLQKRLSVSIIDCLDKDFLSSLAYKKLNLEKSFNTSLFDYFGNPKGIVSASCNSPSDCIKAAVLAVRMGYVFIPKDENNKYLAKYLRTTDNAKLLPLIYLGDKQDIIHHIEDGQIGKYLCLSSDKEIFAFMCKSGLPIDYLILINSYDLLKEKEEVNSLGDLWVNGISLLSPLLASYRNAFVYDICSDNPISEKIELEINEFIKEINFQPKYFAIMASPGAVPFIYSATKTLATEAEDMVRDIHLQLNNDIFFDVAEGRLFQSTTSGLNMQLLSTKYYQEINDKPQKQVLIATTPYVEKGIIFNSDDALIEAYLKPLLEKSGNEVKILTHINTRFDIVASQLSESDYFLYTGHGNIETLNTHGRYLTRDDFMDLPPLIAYASACSTISPRPYLFSVDEGLKWEEIAVKPENVIGLSIVEKGAVCFVGGATSEDLQYTTATYGMFMEALLLDGMSVGEALNKIRNFVSLYSSFLNQKAQEAYRIYKDGKANYIHQQLLLGDPALVPHPKETNTKAVTTSIKSKELEIKIEIDISPESWKRVSAPINDKGPSQKYYRCRTVEVITPVAEGLAPWGDYYLISPTADGLFEKGIMSNFLHMKIDMPTGKVPQQLELVDVVADGECAVCGNKHELEKSALDYFSHFKFPYLMLPPLDLNMKNGWPFSVETIGEQLRVHFLIPLAVIDDRTKTLIKSRKFTFNFKLSKAKEIKGIINSKTIECDNSFLVRAVLDENKSFSLNEAIVNHGEEFSMLCPQEAMGLIAEEQFPLYSHLGNYPAFENELFKLYPNNSRTEINLKPSKLGVITGRVVDSQNAKPISGALVRIWRGKLDPNGYELIEGYIGECNTSSEGSFSFSLKPGNYLLSIAARSDICLYKAKQFEISIDNLDEKYMVFSLDAAAIVKGKIIFKGHQPPYANVKLKRFSIDKCDETLVSVPVRRDGTYECAVGFQDRFSITIELEGWETINDHNFNKGYKLSVNQQLIKNYTVFPNLKGDMKNE